MKTLIVILASFLFILEIDAYNGPYAPPANNDSTTAIFKDSSIFIGWATSASINRGFQNITNTSLGTATIGDLNSPIGSPTTNGVISLGDGGIATLTFDKVISNGPGADFAVFENSFDGLFLELAFVEVSSDGVNFFRFEAVSLTQTNTQIGSFDNLDATNLYNLAGKYQAQYGTPFDLEELAGNALLDINRVTHVRIIDVIGNIDPSFATYDSQNNIVNDPWPTPFGSGGFDLDAVGIINSITTDINETKNSPISATYPNPVTTNLTVLLNENAEHNYQIVDLNGRVVQEGISNDIDFQIDFTKIESGIYFLKVNTDKKNSVTKVIKQ